MTRDFPNHVVIRIRRSTHAKLKAACILVSELGWARSGLKGEGPATLCATLDAILDSELARLREKIKR